MPVYIPSNVLPIFNKKIAKYIARLKVCSLSLSKILYSYKLFLWPSLKYIALLLFLPLRSFSNSNDISICFIR